jgi:hypothetical protein
MTTTDDSHPKQKDSKTTQHNNHSQLFQQQLSKNHWWNLEHAASG